MVKAEIKMNELKKSIEHSKSENMHLKEHIWTCCCYCHFFSDSHATVTTIKRLISQSQSSPELGVTNGL